MNLVKRIYKGHINYFLISALIYTIIFIIGMIFSQKTELKMNPQNMEFFPTLGHNCLIGLALVVLGILTFGILNSIYLCYNSIILSITLTGVYNAYGFKPILTGVLPHAITELIATLICCTLGYESIRFVKILKKNAKSEEKEVLHFKDTVILLAISFLLFVISAAIESNISDIIL